MGTPIYRGIHTSLYRSLPVDIVQNLERAIWLKLIGQVAGARAIFCHDLKPFITNPVVTIEYADLEQEAGRWGTAWRILDSGIKDAKEEKKNLDAPEYRLMAITWAMLGTRHRGDIISSAREVERTQIWLCNVPVTEYTDIQASCVRRYVIAYLFTKLYSAYQNDEAEHIPTHVDDSNKSMSRKPWGGLHQLRHFFCDCGMFNEANALFRVELNRTPPEDREPVVKEFLSAVAGATSKHDRDYIEASVRLQWANTCAMLQNLPLAEEEIMKSETAFHKFCDRFELTNMMYMPHMQALEYEKLSYIKDPFEKLRRTEELADTLEKLESNKVDMCLSDAAELAIAFYKVTSIQEYQNKYFDLHSRLENYDETVSEDITHLVSHRCELFSVTFSSLKDQQKSLEWINGFLKQYPHFSSPVVMSNLYRRQSLLLKALRRINEANIADEKAKELEGAEPWTGNWLHLRTRPTPLPLVESTSSPAYESEEEDTGEPFYWPWRHVIIDQDKAGEMEINLLWEWCLDDVAAGHLAIQDFESMMNVTNAHSAIIFPERKADLENLKSKTASDMASIIFIKEPYLDGSQEDRYDRICKWLSEARKGHRNRRIFCLLMLRNARQSYFSENKMYDLRIRELHRLIELEKTVPRLVREMFPRNKGSWLGALAMTYIALLDAVSDLTPAGVLEHLLSADKFNELALEELRHTKDRASTALHQRTGAQICMLKIRRQQQLLKQTTSDAESTAEDASTNSYDARGSSTRRNSEAIDEIKRLRAVGIKRIEEADEILRESDTHASWSDGPDGLDGITYRQEFTAFHGSGHTVRMAIYLLLSEPGKPSQETVSSVWSWVQKYKARSLARAIGVHSYNPPDLVASIMASPDIRPLYEEMLYLQKRISEAELIARFELRRQLDAHLSVMKKKHVLLRQLLDLREATPFEASDIANIESQAGEPVVLVDWFHLPPYITGDAERFLLFTARSGSEPTMDLLTTTEEDILAWQREFLFPSEITAYREENLNNLEARQTFERVLGGLVAPLAYRTNPRDVLVLCPSGILHRIPLHALSLRIDPFDPEDFTVEGLIHRNPIVYTHSHPLLRSCFAAAEHTRRSPLPMNALFLSGIPKNEESYYNEDTKQQFNYSEGRRSIQELARRFNTTSMMDDGASKNKFLSAATKSRLLHLHTHCNWNSEDPLTHHVEFPQANTPGEKRPEPLMRQVDRLTARELFDVRVPPGTHVNMIACQGGVTDVKLGDEVMGLVPALLYSGASSTVSTLWSIGDGDGAIFAKYFFDSFLQQCATQKDKGIPRRAGVSQTYDAASNSDSENFGGFVNLAKAVRTAVMRMDKLQAVPLYKWAGFVLHGFWQFPLSADNIKSAQARLP